MTVRAIVNKYIVFTSPNYYKDTVILQGTSPIRIEMFQPRITVINQNNVVLIGSEASL